MNIRMFVPVLLLTPPHTRMSADVLACIFTFLHIFLFSVDLKGETKEESGRGKEWEREKNHRPIIYIYIYMCVCVCVCVCVIFKWFVCR